MHFSYPRSTNYFFPALLACMIFVGASCTLANPSSSNSAATSANDAMEQNDALDTNDTGDVSSISDDPDMAQGEPVTDDVMSVKRPSASVALLPQNNSGMSGMVALTEIEEGKVSVEIKMEGIPSTVARPAHIHKGECPTPGAVAHSLTNIVDERSESTLSTSFADLLAMMPLAINVHKSFAEANIYVACGDIPAEEIRAMAGVAPANTPDPGPSVETKSEEEAQGAPTMVVGEEKSGAYVSYDPNLYNAASRFSKRVLFFHASWCPTCKVANQDFTDNMNGLPVGVTVFKVDYDTEKELKTKYGVTYQHTFVYVDAEGNTIAKWSGGGVQELIAHIQ